MLYQPGDVVLSKYRVERFIGKGASAEVYLVTHLELKAPRALKILSRDLPGVGSTAFGDYSQRFQLEAQLGARINHPNVIQVHDFHEDEVTLLLVMEYAAGGSLAGRIARARDAGQPVPVEEAVRIAADAAQGLSALHALDCVHRDLKPPNILLDAQGRAKLADLGLAQIPGGPSQRSVLSQPMAHPGTPAYMSPEQRTSNDHLSPASDVYALGCVLFELLTGRLLRNAKPGTRVRALRSDVPAWLDDLIARMVETDPERRPWDGGEVASPLAEEVRRQAMAQAAAEAERQAVVREAARVEEKARLRQEDQERQRQEEAEREQVVQAEEARRRQEELDRQHQEEAERERAARAEEARRRQEDQERQQKEEAERERAAQTEEARRRQEDQERQQKEEAERERAAQTEEARRRQEDLERQQREEAERERQARLLMLASGVTLELVRIPAGPFLMGSADSDLEADSDEKPQHTVTLQEYYIGKYEVTVAQFAAFVEATGYKTTAEKEGLAKAYNSHGWSAVKGTDWEHPRGPGSNVGLKAAHPVTQVSWDDAVAFTKWVSQVTGRGVRLPTEAEWEKAARGADGRAYPWGNGAPDSSRCNFNLSSKDTTPVGAYNIRGDSPYGATDMCGNVWEWTSSQHRGYPYFADDDREEGTSGHPRVLRGGSFDNQPRYLRSADRDLTRPDYRAGYIGFRVVASPIGL
jgi:formylglycine-generating enzyme required for sulfatase activity